MMHATPGAVASAGRTVSAGRARSRSHGTADRHAVESARPHVGHVVGRNAADGESGQADLGTHGPQKLQARELPSNSLRPRRKDRPHADIIGAVEHRFPELVPNCGSKRTRRRAGTDDRTRASFTVSSSWPTCTPSAPANRAMSGRSFMMNNVFEPRVCRRTTSGLHGPAIRDRSSSSVRQLDHVDFGRHQSVDPVGKFIDRLASIDQHIQPRRCQPVEAIGGDVDRFAPACKPDVTQMFEPPRQSGAARWFWHIPPGWQGAALLESLEVGGDDCPQIGSVLLGRQAECRADVGRAFRGQRAAEPSERPIAPPSERDATTCTLRPGGDRRARSVRSLRSRVSPRRRDCPPHRESAVGRCSPRDRQFLSRSPAARVDRVLAGIAGRPNDSIGMGQGGPPMHRHAAYRARWEAARDRGRPGDRFRPLVLPHSSPCAASHPATSFPPPGQTQQEDARSLAREDADSRPGAMRPAERHREPRAKAAPANRAFPEEPIRTLASEFAP